jgi:hypothetical protein
VHLEKRQYLFVNDRVLGVQRRSDDTECAFTVAEVGKMDTETLHRILG